MTSRVRYLVNVAPGISLSALNSSVMPKLGGEIPGAWDISTAVFSQSFSVSAQETGPNGVFFKPDGLKMYIVGSSADNVKEYDLNTAWDISTASHLQTEPVDGYFVEDLFFKDDGTKMYILWRGGTVGDYIYEYDLSTAWDVSTKSAYVSRLRVFSQDPAPHGLFFKPDGTKMYVTGALNDSVYEYDLSTDWDISTATYSQNLSVSAQDTNPQGVFFKPDGAKMYIVGTSSDAVNEYDLSTAWDISTATYSQNFSVSAQDTVPTSVFFKPDGTKMYVTGDSGDDVNEYDLGT